MTQGFFTPPPRETLATLQVPGKNGIRVQLELIQPRPDLKKLPKKKVRDYLNTFDFRSFLLYSSNLNQLRNIGKEKEISFGFVPGAS